MVRQLTKQLFVLPPLYAILPGTRPPQSPGAQARVLQLPDPMVLENGPRFGRREARWRIIASGPQPVGGGNLIGAVDKSHGG